MKRLHFILLSIMLSVCLCNCDLYRPDFLPEWQTARFRAGENTHVDQLIDIDGYYIASPYTDSVRTLPFLLYNDGTFGNFRFQKSKYYEQKPRYIDMYNDTIVYIILNTGNYTYCKGGHYVIDKDTILVDQYYDTASSIYGLMKLKFVIIDRQHVRLVQRQYLSLKHNGIVTKKTDELYEFIPVKRKLPSFGVSIKDAEKEVWYKKEDYKEFNRQYWRRYNAYNDSVRRRNREIYLEELRTKNDTTKWNLWKRLGF